MPFEWHIECHFGVCFSSVSRFKRYQFQNQWCPISIFFAVLHASVR